MTGESLRRNVLYRDGAETAGGILPFTANDSLNPQDLWRWMARYEAATGGKVLALAHNGNLSNSEPSPGHLTDLTFPVAEGVEPRQTREFGASGYAAPDGA